MRCGEGEEDGFGAVVCPPTCLRVLPRQRWPQYPRHIDLPRASLNHLNHHLHRDQCGEIYGVLGLGDCQNDKHRHYACNDSRYWCNNNCYCQCFHWLAHIAVCMSPCVSGHCPPNTNTNNGWKKCE